MWGKLWALTFLIGSLQTGPTCHELSRRGKKSEDADIITLSSTAGAAKWMLAFSVSFLFCTSVKLVRLIEGRPVYKKGNGSTARFLHVGEGGTLWIVRYTKDLSICTGTLLLNTVYRRHQEVFPCFRVAELGCLSSGAKMAMKILSTSYLQFSRQMRRFCA